MSSQYNKIVTAFKNLGYSQTSVLIEFEINKAMDKISAVSGLPGELDREVARQLWEHTRKQGANTVILRDYIRSIIDALNVLKQHINATQQKLNYQSNQADKQQLQADLLSYVNDYKLLTQPFNLPNVPESKAIAESKANLYALNGSPAYAGGSNEEGWTRTSQIFAMKPSVHQESWSLKIVLIITGLLFMFELFIIFHKNHFFNLLGYILILLIYIQNFFDKTYMRMVIIWIGLSVLFDFLWLIVHSQNWWNPYPQTQHSTVQNSYLRLSYFLVICTMLAKILVFILLLRLDGQSAKNPITQALIGNRQQFSGMPQNNFENF